MVQASTSGAAVSLAKVDTEYSADCIEWCPSEGFQDIFICGTYQVLEPTKPSDDSSATSSEDQVRETRDVGDSDDELEEESPKQTQRTGRLLVYQVSSDQTNLKEIQRIDTPAILDAKWSPNLAQSGYPELAVADAKGHITIYHFGSDSRQLEEVQSIEVAEDTILCLSLDYSHRLRPTDTPHIITSLSSGHLVHLTPSSHGYEVEQTWKAHDYEPWCVTWDNWDTCVVWSGGDDLKLKRWNIHSTTFPTLVNKDFEAGVTTITSSPHTPHLLTVGSYDASVRLYDTREPKQPLQTIECGGGIWRSRFHPDQARANELLIASMHDGFKVIRIDQSISPTPKDDTPNESQDANPIIRRFDGHTSLAYGADWSKLPGRDGEDTTLVATCSFYDHTLHLWRG